MTVEPTTNHKPCGMVFDVQRYSIHDGPGIRTIVFLKGCPLRCHWCSNPESQSPSIELLYSRVKCRGCQKCLLLCPTGAIRWIDSDGVKIDRNKCQICGKCAQECFADALKLVGCQYNVEELFQMVMRDEIFFRISGGGITVGGGEPLFQPEFLKDFLNLSRSAGVHTTIETSGFAPRTVAEEIFDLADLIFLDLKHIDNHKHSQMTGVSNEVIINNWLYAVKDMQKVVCRLPLIPKFNDTIEEIIQILDFIKDVRCEEIHILPYHHLGEGKYAGLGREYTMKDIKPPDEKLLSDILTLAQKRGLRAQIGG